MVICHIHVPFISVLQGIDMEEQIEEDSNSEEFQPEEAPASEEEFQGPLECSIIKTKVSCHKDLSGKNFICNICDRQYANRANLNRHLKKHNDKFTFECKKCTQYFSTQDALNEHQKTRHGSKTHLCTSCGKAYGKRAHLTVHQRRFHQSEYLEPNLICPFENCTKTFQQKERYEDHLNVHDNVKPYSCSKCKREFHSRYYKNSHEKMCTGKISYKCDECDQVFCDKSSLARHKNTQHNSKVYDCSCGKTYLYENSLRQHIRSKHY